MSDITEITPALIGKKVQSAARPEWGSGEVLLVKPETVNGQAVSRVSIQFAAGHKTLLVPPARLIEPRPAAPPPKAGGWIDQLAKKTPEDTLRALPESVTQMLGTFEQRIAALAELYRFDHSESGLLQWARRQAEMADPLARWSRDELSEAFDQFCRKRDEYLRNIISEARRKRGPTVVTDALFAVPIELREQVRQAIR